LIQSSNILTPAFVWSGLLVILLSMVIGAVIGVMRREQPLQGRAKVYLDTGEEVDVEILSRRGKSLICRRLKDGAEILISLSSVVAIEQPLEVVENESHNI